MLGVVTLCSHSVTDSCQQIPTAFFAVCVPIMLGVVTLCSHSVTDSCQQILSRVIDSFICSPDHVNFSLHYYIT